MKKNIIERFALALSFPFLLATCSGDTNAFSASDVCPEDGVNAYGMANRGTFTDERDGREYKYTTIGDQVWMAENLDYVTEYSACYDNNMSNCETWGRFYALQDDNSYWNLLDWSKVDTICPTGWHIPSNDDWFKMIHEIGEFQDEESAIRLKSISFWDKSQLEGTDDCDFAAIPSGYLYNSGEGADMYYWAEFWSSTMKDGSGAYRIHIGNSIGNYDTSHDLFLSIRCVKD